MSLEDTIKQIAGREELALFVEQLSLDFTKNYDTWEHASINAYLEAIAAWLRDMEGYYQNSGTIMPNNPSWQTFAEILLAAKYYE